MAGTNVRLGLVSSEEQPHQDPVAAFISKVWKIVEKPEYNHLIGWSNVSVGLTELEIQRWLGEVSN